MGKSRDLAPSFVLAIAEGCSEVAEAQNLDGLPGCVAALLLDGFLFQLFEFFGQLLGLVVKTLEALGQ